MSDVKIDLAQLVKTVMISSKKFSELNEIISKQSESESKERVVFSEGYSARKI